MNGGQVVPPSTSPAFGVAYLTYDTSLKRLCFSITYSRLDGPETEAHLHGGKSGTTDVVFFDLPLGSPKKSCVGPFGKKEEMVFLGREISSHKDYSEQTAVTIDEEVRKIAEECYVEALRLLRENVEKLHQVANALLERETIDGSEMDRLLKGETLAPVKRHDDGPPAPAAPAIASAPESPGPSLGAFDPPPTPRPAGA